MEQMCVEIGRSLTAAGNNSNDSTTRYLC